MTDLFNNPPEPEPQGDPGRWVDRPGPNGTTRRWWLPTLRPAPAKRDMSRSAIEHSRAKKHDRKTAKPYRSARQLAGDIAEANGEAETETIEKGSEE
jgi:hypothetical protein